MRLWLKLNTGFFLIIIMMSITGYYSVYSLNKLMTPLSTELPATISALAASSRLDSLAQFVRYYDEVLTQSARNYAFTGDKAWEQRYLEAEPKLDQVIKEMIRLGGDTDKQFFSNVDAANLALVDMEHKSLAYTDAGNEGEAIKVLASQEYSRQKEIYKQGLVQYLATRGNKYDEALNTSTKTLDFVSKQTTDLARHVKNVIIALVVASLVFAVGIIYMTYMSISKPVLELKNAVTEMSKGNLNTRIHTNSRDEISELGAVFNNMADNLKESSKGLLEIRRKLEATVDKRTKELQKKNQQLEKFNKLMVGRELRMLEMKKKMKNEKNEKN